MLFEFTVHLYNWKTTGWNAHFASIIVRRRGYSSVKCFFGVRDTQLIQFHNCLKRIQCNKPLNVSSSSEDFDDCVCNTRFPITSMFGKHTSIDRLFLLQVQSDIHWIAERCWMLQFWYELLSSLWLNHEKSGLQVTRILSKLLLFSGQELGTLQRTLSKNYSN